MSRTTTIALIVILTIASLVIGQATAISIQTPSVPEFTVKYVDRSYDVPPTYGTDPYSGKTVQTGGGHIENRTIEVTIKDQTFSRYKNEDDKWVDLHYQVGFKGHFGQEWGVYSATAHYLPSGYTVIVFGLGPIHHISGPHVDLGAISPGDQLDFRVQARIGYFSLAPGHDIFEQGSTIFNGELSGWSAPKTITYLDGPMTTSTSQPPMLSPTPIITAPSSANPTATPVQPDTQTDVILGLDWQSAVIVGLVVVVAVLAVGLVALWRRVAAAKGSLAS